jgi:peptide deformylase
MGDTRLMGVASAVEDIEAEDIAALIEDMRETLDDIQATGLAAPQIAVDKRVVLYSVPSGRIPAGSAQDPVPWTVMINPVITPLTGEKEPIWERCLSLPGLYGKVPRFTRIQAGYTTLDGQAVKFEAKGFHAMLVQHECDHLDGVLYPMRMEDLSGFGFVEEITGGGAIYPYSPGEFDG